MKIGIVTFIRTINFGASLQAYALQKAAEAMGHQAEIIQYVNKEIEAKEKNTRVHNLRTLYRKIIMGNGLKKKTRAFSKFESENIRFGMELTENTREAVNRSYDRFITGSDQVWNMAITHEDWNYFLSFVDDDRKKCAYAPSFGNAKFPEADYEQAKAYLERFAHLSVREKSGQELIQKLCGRTAEVVVDPTLLLDKQEWSSLIREKPPLDHYILVYFPHDKSKMFAFAEALQAKTGLPIVYLSISPRGWKKARTIYDASPEQWLSWINHADYVVTGSFHGTAFSVNLGKQLFYEPTGKGSRIENLMEQCGILWRSIDTEGVMDTEIRYDEVGPRLEQIRASSRSWLQNMLEDEA